MRILPSACGRLSSLPTSTRRWPSSPRWRGTRPAGRGDRAGGAHASRAVPAGSGARSQAFAANLRARDVSAKAAPSDRLVEIPTLYDGEDLDDVARLTGLSPAEVIARHVACEFTVAFTGFARASAISSAATRRCTWRGGRARAPASPGTVARRAISRASTRRRGRAAGSSSARRRSGCSIFRANPRRSSSRARACAFTRLTDRAAASTPSPPPRPRAGRRRPRPHRRAARSCASQPRRCRRSSRTTGGRQAAQGVSASGALDRAALHAANRLLGNAAGEPALEIVGGGFAFEADGPAVVAVTGTDAGLEIRDADGRRHVAPAYAPASLEAGDRVTLRAPARGLRTYLSARGGFSVEPVLGSASVDSLARLGPPPVSRETGSPSGRAAAARPSGAPEPFRPIFPRWRDGGARRRHGPAHRVVHGQGHRDPDGAGLDGDAALQPRRPAHRGRGAPRTPRPQAELPSEGHGEPARSRCRTTASRCSSSPTIRSPAAIP